MNALSGVIAITCSEFKEIYFINAYKMTVLKKIQHNFEGLKPESHLKLSFRERVMILQGKRSNNNLIDTSRDLLQVWNRGDVDSSRSVADLHSSASSSFTPHQQALLDMSGPEDLLLAQLLNFVSSFLKAYQYRP
jgi:hypothetical protein